MIVVSARVTGNNHEELAKWRMVNHIVLNNLPDDMKAKWTTEGYKGISSTVPKYFGMNKMYYGPTSHLTFEFTEKQWTMFILRWA